MNQGGCELHTKTLQQTLKIEQFNSGHSFQEIRKLGTGNKKQWQVMIISQALKLQDDFNRTVKICKHSFGNEKVSCAYKKKQYSYYNYLAIKMRFGK